MPNDRRLLRAAVGGPPSYPGYGGYAGGSRLIDLIMFGGQQQAEAAREQGQMWGDTIAGVGQQIGAGLEKHAQQKAMAKRDAAWVSFVNGGEWAQDPKIALSKSIEIWGPQEGPKQFQALAATSQLMQPKRNPEADQKALATLGAAYLKMGPGGRQTLYPQIRALTAGALPEFGSQMPEQYDPAFDESVVVPYVQSIQGPRKLGTAAPGSVVFDEATGEKVLENPPAPKEPKKYEVTVPGPGGRPIKKLVTEEELAAGVQEYRAPVAGPRPQLEKIETVDAQGRPITKYVTPQAGAEYAKPTGQGKPATGQQRKALSYFNRAKEASEDVLAMEDKVATEAGLLGRAQLQYAPNILQTADQQRYRQAQRAFTEARLRKDSGATIKEEEYENDALTYFAQPGDSPQLIAQKRASREAALQSIAFEAGDAMREFYGDEAETMLRPRGGAKPPQAPVRVSSKAEFDRLPSGATFIAPDGSVRRKP